MASPTPPRRPPCGGSTPSTACRRTSRTARSTPPRTGRSWCRWARSTATTRPWRRWRSTSGARSSTCSGAPARRRGSSWRRWRRRRAVARPRRPGRFPAGDGHGRVLPARGDPGGGGRRRAGGLRGQRPHLQPARRAVHVPLRPPRHAHDGEPAAPARAPEARSRRLRPRRSDGRRDQQHGAPVRVVDSRSPGATRRRAGPAPDRRLPPEPAPRHAEPGVQGAARRVRAVGDGAGPVGDPLRAEPHAQPPRHPLPPRRALHPGARRRRGHGAQAPQPHGVRAAARRRRRQEQRGDGVRLLHGQRHQVGRRRQAAVVQGRALERARRRQGRGQDVQPAGAQGRAGQAQPAPRRARRGQRLPGDKVERVARQPHPEPRGQPVGDHLPRRGRLSPRAHHRADSLHRAAVLRPAAAQCLEPQLSRRTVILLNLLVRSYAQFIDQESVLFGSGVGNTSSLVIQRVCTLSYSGEPFQPAHLVRGLISFNWFIMRGGSVPSYNILECIGPEDWLMVAT